MDYSNKSEFTKYENIYYITLILSINQPAAMWNMFRDRYKYLDQSSFHSKFYGH